MKNDASHTKTQIVSVLTEKGVFIKDDDISFFSKKKEPITMFFMSSITFFLCLLSFPNVIDGTILNHENGGAVYAISRLFEPILPYLFILFLIASLYYSLRSLIIFFNSFREFSFIALTNDFLYISRYGDLKKIKLTSIDLISIDVGNNVHIRYDKSENLKMKPIRMKNINIFYEILKEKTGLKG
jgi:hypothetical protein